VIVKGVDIFEVAIEAVVELYSSMSAGCSSTCDRSPTSKICVSLCARSFLGRFDKLLQAFVINV